MSRSKTLQPTEPTVAAFAGDSLGARLRRLLLAARPAFFPASVAPVIVGSVWGYHIAGHFDWMVFALALIATLSVHLGSNVLNDVGDDASGTDRINEARIFPYTGGSRFIQNGIMSAREMTLWGVTLLAIGALLGVLLMMLRGPAVLLFGLAGIALGVLYSLPRVQLAARGIGEAAIAVAFGVLPVCGAAWLQDARVDGSSVLISVPLSLWVAAILLMNEVPDRVADAQAGKRTLVVRLGFDGARRLYLALQLTAWGALLAAAVLQLLPWWTPIGGLLLLPGAWLAGSGVRAAPRREALTRSIETTLRLHTAGALLLVLAILFARH